MKTRLQIPSVPHLVHIETTYWCNQDCRFCYNPRRFDKIDQAIVEKVVRSVHNSYIPHVYLIGGEPSGLGSKRLNSYIDLLSERSSVTIVTNGQIYLKDLSDKLACIGVPLHGNEETHDYLARKQGSYRRAVDSIQKYVARGFDVRCIPVLTQLNFDQIYGIIELAHTLKMESVFVDRFEDGGLGSQNKEDQLKPSLEEFRIALGQMIQARDEFKIPVGWGTAIPYCLDKRLITHRMWADCGAGMTFAAINPDGDVRVCNQSEKVYGNVLTDPLEIIWKRPGLDEFRNLSWVTKPCTNCQILADCLCGCKVDANFSDGFSVDYAIRGLDCPPFPIEELSEPDPKVEIPDHYRTFRLNRFSRLNQRHEEPYLITRYQTIRLDAFGVQMLEQLFDGVTAEKQLISLNLHLDEYEVRKFISTLEFVGALDVLKE